MSPSKQAASKKESLIHNFDEEDERAEDAGSLSPLASKSIRNNTFQDDMFKEIETDQDLKQNKKTSDYLFNYDLLEDEIDPNIPKNEEDKEPYLNINLQLEKMSDDTNSNPNSQREADYDIFNQNALNQNDEELEHNNKAFQQIMQEKKPSNLK